MNTLTCEEARELLPLMALDVLDVDECDVLDDHLAACAECREALAGHLETTAALAMAVPQADPSPSVKGRLLAQASRARMLPAGADVRAIPSPPMWGRGRAARWRVSLTGIAAGLALVLAAGSTGWALSLRSQIDDQNQRIASLNERAQNYGRVSAVLQAADTQVRLLQGTAGAPSAFGRVYIDPETSEGMLMVRGLPPLPQGKVYQLWVVGADGQRMSAGVLTWTDKAGNGYTLINCPDKLSRWQSFGVTEEPSGGSPAPTTPRVLGGTI
ncbi:MAG: anti-sigma factor [Chloroflexota bacterium]